MGDFNVPHASFSTGPDDAPASCPLVRLACDLHLAQHVNEPTRFNDEHNSSTLDLIFTNEAEMISRVSVLPPLGTSDHAVLEFIFICEVSVNEGTVAPRPNFFKADYGSMRSFFREQQVLVSTNFQTVDDHWAFLLKMFQQAIRRFVPLSMPRPPRTKQLRSSTLRLIRHKHELWREHIANPTETTLAIYKTARNNCTQSVRSDKREFQIRVSRLSLSNPKAFYKIVASRTKSRGGLAALMDDGVLTTTPLETAEVLSNFYSSISSSYDEARSHDYPKPPLADPSFITTTKIVNKLRRLGPNKCPGVDGVHPRFFALVPLK
jgi:hypothetical protein